MKKVKKYLISIGILFVFLFIGLVAFSSVQAAGLDGTTIVLNPRTWWKLDWMC